MTKILNADEIQVRLESLAGWHLNGKEIRKQWKFADFRESMRFINAVATEAEKVDHHPEIAINYDKVNLTLSTHSAGGLTDKDFDLARCIDFI